MTDYLMKEGLKVEIKEIIEENYSIKSIYPIFHLKETSILKLKCEKNYEILKFYHELISLKNAKISSNSQIHKLLTSFFIKNDKMNIFSRILHLSISLIS